MTPTRKNFPLSEIIRTYSRTLYAFIRRFGFNDSETKDILQDTFIKLWKYSSTFDEQKSSLKTWIFTVTRNTLYDALRKKKRDFEHTKDTAIDDTFVDDIEDKTKDIITILENIKTKGLLLQAIDTLNDEEKTILFLHIEESMTFNEISIILNIPINTVKSKYRRLLLKLRTILEVLPR